MPPNQPTPPGNPPAPGYPPNQPPGNYPPNQPPAPGYPPNQPAPGGYPPANQPPGGYPPGQTPPPPNQPPAPGYPPNQPPGNYPPNQPAPGGYPPGQPPAPGGGQQPAHGYTPPNNPHQSSGSSGKGLKIGLFVVIGLIIVGAVGLVLMFFLFFNNNIDGILEEANITCEEQELGDYRDEVGETWSDSERNKLEDLLDDIKGPVFKCEDDESKEYIRVSVSDFRVLMEIGAAENETYLSGLCDEDAETAQEEFDDGVEGFTLQLKGWVFVRFNTEELEKQLEVAGAEIEEVETIDICD